MTKLAAIQFILSIKSSVESFLLGLWNRWRHGTADYPRAISLETSLVCNRACHYCPVSLSDTPKQKVPNQAVVDAFIASLKSLDFAGEIGWIFYNEPLLNRQLEAIVKQVADACPKTRRVLYTNGDKLTHERFVSLRKAGMDKFVVSRHEPITQEWDRRLNALKAMYPRRIKIVRHRPWYNRGGLIDQLPGANSLKGATSCSVPENVHVGLDGEVMLCCNDYERKNVRGNILNMSLKEIWFSPSFVELRHSLKRGNFELPICKVCTS